jgi:uncharacterized protein (TIGR02145 family)
MNPFAKFAATHTTVFIAIILAFISCDKGNLPPIAKMTAFPPFGDTSILFDFNAEGTTDDKNYPIGLVFRWDFDGDGVWDTGYSKTNGIAHQYKLPGKYEVIVGVKDIDGLTAIATDSVEVYGKNNNIDTLVDPRDGNRYRIVNINGRWWMAENLRYGIEIPTDRDQTDNDTVEMYSTHQSKLLDTVGGVYHWYESMNYRIQDPKGICPDGWHIPTKPEWEALFLPYKDLSAVYYRELYSLQYYGRNGSSNLNLDLNNGAERWDDGSFWWRRPSSWSGGFWSSSSSYSPLEWDYRPYVCWFDSKYLFLHVDFDATRKTYPIWYFSVRCVKDI